MTIVRRNPLQSAVGALLAVGLVVSVVVAASGTGVFKNAAACGSGYGYSFDPNNQAGYGYAPACGAASDVFGEGKVFVVQHGQQLTLSGSTGVLNAQGHIYIDFGNTTDPTSRTQPSGAVNSVNGSKPQQQALLPGF